MMERNIYYLLVCAFFCFFNNTFAKSSHLLLSSQGDGALVIGEGEKTTKLARASFLPTNQTISVRTRSGIETMVAGSNFRFGSETNFILEEDTISLNSGAMMFQSRKISNECVIKSPESNLGITGSGTCVIEVGTSGGLKIVGVLGRFRLKSNLGEPKTKELMPGDLVFLMPGERGFGNSLSVNLKKLISTSYLISGFSNTSSFENSLRQISEQQEKAIGKSYDAEVGDSKNPDTFEIVASSSDGDTQPNNKDQTGPQSVIEDDGYQIPKVDPLTELLGRSPRRFGENAINPISKESSEQLNEITPDSVAEEEVVEKDASEEDDDRPFPSRLLRKNKLQE